MNAVGKSVDLLADSEPDADWGSEDEVWLTIGSASQDKGHLHSQDRHVRVSTRVWWTCSFWAPRSCENAGSYFARLARAVNHGQGPPAQLTRPPLRCR